MRMTLQEIVESVHGAIAALLPLAPEVSGVSTDTRTLQPGDLFVALKGERFDGHDHLAAAFEKGAVAALVDVSRVDHIDPELGILITVPDTLIGFGRIAQRWRRRFSLPVIAVTGSVGKTTTKEMLASALSSLGPILKTDKNENNEIGVPQLLLRLNDQHRAVVVEMGMRGAGQIKYLAGIAEPTVGVITIIGENHIELLGSIDNIADAKGELIDSLPADGLAVLNGDDPYFDMLKSKAKSRVLTYGMGEDATMRVVPIGSTSAGWEADFVYSGTSGREVTKGVVKSPARHDLMNAASAVLVACELGISLADAVRDATAFQPVSMRMETFQVSSGATILSDCYNASPTSMRSAIDTLAEFGGAGRQIAFLGDMKELGEFAPAMHAQIAVSAEEAGLDEVYVVGEMFAQQFPKAKFKFRDSGEAAEFAAANLELEAGDVVLVKGSRAMTMERIVEALKPT